MKCSRMIAATLMLSLFVVLGACSKKPVMDAEPAQPAASAIEAPAAPAASEPGSATLTTVSGDRLEPVYFDYDSHALSPAAEDALRRNAALLQQAPALKVTIEGHCDERGSDEYNLALGSQRADAVKSYLTALGVAGERLTAISYGEERPAVAGSDESAWSKNRRAAFN